MQRDDAWNDLGSIRRNKEGQHKSQRGKKQPARKVDVNRGKRVHLKDNNGQQRERCKPPSVQRDTEG